MPKASCASGELERFMEDLRVTHELLLDEISSLTDDQLDWSPGGKAPSARQILEHLINAEKMLLDAAKKMQLTVALQEYQDGQNPRS